MKILQLIIFITTMIYAGIYDYKKRIIPDSVHLIIIGNTFLLNFNPIKSLVGLFFLSVPFIIPVLFNYNSIGGGDIKLVASIGFFLGLDIGLKGLIIGLTVATIFNIVIFNKEKHETFPLAPYLAIGSIIALTI